MQSAVIQWARLQTPSLLALAALFAVPNGARVTPSVASRLRKEGMRAGIPDVLLPVPADGYAGLAVELKTSTGQASKDQRAWHSALRAMGHRVEICRTIESACAVLREHALAWERQATEPARAALLALWTRYMEAERERAVQKEKRPVAAGRRIGS